MNNVNLKKILTTCTLNKEIAAQRWFVHSFLDSKSSTGRRKASSAAMKIFSISKERSLELYDQTLLEVRRQLLETEKIPTIKVSQLRGPWYKTLAPYLEILGKERFNKLVFLMRGVAPSANFNPNNLIDGCAFGIPLFREEEMDQSNAKE